MTSTLLRADAELVLRAGKDASPRKVLASAVPDLNPPLAFASAGCGDMGTTKPKLRTDMGCTIPPARHRDRVRGLPDRAPVFRAAFGHGRFSASRVFLPRLGGGELFHRVGRAKPALGRGPALRRRAGRPFRLEICADRRRPALRRRAGADGASRLGHGFSTSAPAR